MDLAERVDRAVRRMPPGVRALTAIQGDRTVAHHWSPPEPTDLRSLTKTVVALAVGVAVDRRERLGELTWSVDLTVPQVLAQVPALARLPGLAAWSPVRIGHLMSNTIGHHRGFGFRADLAGRDPDRLLEQIVAAPLAHPAGTHFAYSNVGWSLLSAMVQELTGQRLSDWVAERVTGPLGIEALAWRRHGRYDAGGTGLRLAPVDLHRLAELLRQQGRAGDRRVIGTEWCRRMTSPLVPTPDRWDPTATLPKSGYGYGIWSCGDGRYFGDGTGGQYLVVDPERELAVTVLSGDSDMDAIQDALAPLVRRAAPAASRPPGDGG